VHKNEGIRLLPSLGRIMNRKNYDVKASAECPAAVSGHCWQKGIEKGGIGNG